MRASGVGPGSALRRRVLGGGDGGGFAVGSGRDGGGAGGGGLARTWSGLVSECDTMDNQNCETKSQLEVLASSVAVLMLLVGPIRAEDEQTLISFHEAGFFRELQWKRIKHDKMDEKAID